MLKGTDMVTHINSIKIISNHLKAVGDPVTDKDLVMILISSLPDDYNTLITTLETLKEDKLTWDYDRDRMIIEYERRNHNQHLTDALFTNTQKGYRNSHMQNGKYYSSQKQNNGTGKKR